MVAPALRLLPWAQTNSHLAPSDPPLMENQPEDDSLSIYLFMYNFPRLAVALRCRALVEAPLGCARASLGCPVGGTGGAERASREEDGARSEAPCLVQGVSSPAGSAHEKS